MEKLSTHYIGSSYISSTLCDVLLQEMEDNEYRSKKDPARGYYRLPNSCLTKSTNDRFIYELNNCMGKYTEQFPWSRRTEQWGFTTPYNLQKFHAGDSYSTVHLEETGPKEGKMLRHLTFLTYLNDVNLGGETLFPAADIKITPKKGLTLIWPAGWTHPHKGLPAVKENKYIITGWYSFKHRC